MGFIVFVVRFTKNCRLEHSESNFLNFYEYTIDSCDVLENIDLQFGLVWPLLDTNNLNIYCKEMDYTQVDECEKSTNICCIQILHVILSNSYKEARISMINMINNNKRKLNWDILMIKIDRF